jgi:hypothetical protein
VERKSAYTLLRRVDDLKAHTVHTALEHQLAPLPDILRRTATFDNGSEFAEQQRLADAVGMNLYFAKPYSDWQRGTNQNTNGLVCQQWPKGSDLAAENHRVLAAVVGLIGAKAMPTTKQLGDPFLRFDRDHEQAVVKELSRKLISIRTHRSYGFARRRIHRLILPSE